MGHLETIIGVAKHQDGYIANYQVDVSRQMFSHYESTAKLERIQRGIYRVSYFPISDEEPYIVARLWSHERAVVSHQSALALHNLADVLPRNVHLTYPPTEPLPKDIPKFVSLHRALVPNTDRQWHGAFQITTIQRTLVDLAAGGFDPLLFEQALDEAVARGVVSANIERIIIRELMTRRRNA